MSNIFLALLLLASALFFAVAQNNNTDFNNNNNTDIDSDTDIDIDIGIEFNNVTAEITFYGAADNCPPSGIIAYPSSLHPVAGGVGSYSDPITFAADSTKYKPGTRVYLPDFKRYAIMEDDCEECRGSYHIDVWLGSDQSQKGTTDCEVALTRSKGVIVVNPPSTYKTVTTPLFDTKTGCSVPITDPCVDEGNECGNSCELPSTMTCSAAASIFSLSLSRFEQLNPDLACGSGSGKIAKGTSVCQAGSCGGP